MNNRFFNVFSVCYFRTANKSENMQSARKKQEGSQIAEPPPASLCSLRRAPNKSGQAGFDYAPGSSQKLRSGCLRSSAPDAPAFVSRPARPIDPSERQGPGGLGRAGLARLTNSILGDVYVRVQRESDATERVPPSRRDVLLHVRLDSDATERVPPSGRIRTRPATKTAGELRVPLPPKTPRPRLWSGSCAKQ